MKSPRSIAEQAAAWLIRRDRGLTAREQDEFLQWLAADPRHGDAFAREQQTWRDLDLMADWRPEHATEPNPDLLAQPVGSTPIRRRIPWLLPAALGAAACLALVATLTFRSPAPTPAAAAIVASAYEQRVLEDGSIAELNRGAALEIAFTAAERRVRLLRGEAHFTVTKHPERPFIVHARGVEARAVGTAFQVRLDAHAVEVVVTEGRVQVGAPATTQAAARDGAAPVAPLPIVAAGERVVVPLRPAAEPPRVTPVSAEDLARTLAWQPRLLEFSSAPLAQVVAEFNRRNPLQLVLADPALASVPIVASFRSDNVDGFVRLLEVTAGIRATRQGDTIFLRPKKSP
jgi:transmembrane sensor